MSTETDVYEIDASGAVKALNDVAQATGKAADETKGLADFVKGDLKDSLFSAQAEYDMLKSAVKAVGEFLVDSVKEFQFAEQQSMKMAAALRRAGVTSDEFVNSLEQQITAMERTTGADGEMLKQMAATLATMRVAPADINRYMRAALDLSAALGIDATTAARSLGKANAQGREELAGFGVEVSEATFQARGFSAVLEEIEKQYGGLSQQQPELTKQVNELKGAWGDFKEAVGQVVSELVSLKVAGIGVSSVLDWYTEMLTNKTGNALVDYQDKVRRTTVAVDAYGRAVDQVRYAEKQLADFRASPVAGFNDSGLVAQLESARRMQEAAAKRIEDLTGKNPDKAVITLPSVTIDIDKLKEKIRHEKETIRDRARWLKEQELKRVLDELKTSVDGNFKKAEEDEKAHKKKMDAHEKWAMAEMAFEEQRTTNEAQRQQAVNDAKLEQQHEFSAQMAREIRDLGMELVNVGLDQAREQILSVSSFTKAYREAYLERRFVDEQEKKADVTKAEVAAEIAKEEKASQEKRTAETLASIAQQAAAKAIMMAAEAAAFLVYGNIYSAEQAGIAAAMFGAVAVAAGGGAAAISANRGMTREEKDQIESLERRDTEREERKKKVTGASDSIGPGVTQNVYFFGISGMSDVEQAAELERLKRTHDRLKTGA